MNNRILILDDDPAVLEILQLILSDEGYEVTTVETTDDMLALVNACQPALILLDFGLKGKDGGTLCSLLKTQVAFAHIPVVIFTAYANKGMAKGTFGCDDFIAKPFDLDDLLGRIKYLTDPKYIPPAPNPPCNSTNQTLPKP